MVNQGRAVEMYSDDHIYQYFILIFADFLLERFMPNVQYYLNNQGQQKWHSKSFLCFTFVHFQKSQSSLCQGQRTGFRFSVVILQGKKQKHIFK